LIPIDDVGRARPIIPKTNREGIMPTDALLVAVIVVAIFVAFAGALAWADRQTSRSLDSDARRRSS
jgi:hypothetical protein